MALQSELVSRFPGIKMFLEPFSATSFQSSKGTTNPDCPWPASPEAPPMLLRSQDSILAPEGHQSLAQQHCSKAALQLPTALPCSATGPDAPGRYLTPTARIAEVPLSCPSPWLEWWDIPGEPPALPVPWHFLRCLVWTLLDSARLLLHLCSSS